MPSTDSESVAVRASAVENLESATLTAQRPTPLVPSRPPHVTCCVEPSAANASVSTTDDGAATRVFSSASKSW